MAAPIETTLLDFTGRWRLNRDLSDSLEPTFSLQGIPWIIRKVINMATLELQYVNTPCAEDSAAKRFDFKQTVRPGGFDIKNEYVVDGISRISTVPLFGTVAVHCNYVGHEDMIRHEIPDEGVEIVDEDHAALVEVVSNESAGWVGTITWVFETIDGSRRLCKYNTTRRDEKTAKAKMVHDYLGPPII